MKKRGSKTHKASLWSKATSKYGLLYNKRKKTTVFLSVLIIGSLIYIGLIAVELASFRSVEKPIDRLHLSLVEKTNPIEDRDDIYCDHASAKFQKGQLNCYYGFTLRYKGEVSDLNSIANEINNQLNNANLRVGSQQNSSNIDLNKVGYRYESPITYKFADNRPGVVCGAEMTTEKNKDTSVLTLRVDCSKGPMLRPVYPVKD